MSVNDQLVYTTARIETDGPQGKGSGTGFFVNFANKGSSFVPAIVTNKHVIRGVTGGVLYFTLKKSDSEEPDIGAIHAIRFSSFESLWILHPDAEIDLAALPIAPLLDQLVNSGKRPFYIPFTPDIFADQAYLNELTAIEDIIMIGYPIGLWDSTHNFPIVRRGITATPPFVNFEGKKEFLIDCACFPGSSGSPILLYNSGGYMDKKGNTRLGSTRIRLLGTLWGGPQYTTGGSVHIVPVPTNTQTMLIARIPSNLGFCVKAECLRFFEEFFEKRLDQELSKTLLNTPTECG